MGEDEREGGRADHLTLLTFFFSFLSDAAFHRAPTLRLALYLPDRALVASFAHSLERETERDRRRKKKEKKKGQKPREDGHKESTGEERSGSWRDTHSVFFSPAEAKWHDEGGSRC